MNNNRRLAAILYADIAGFSSLIHTDKKTRETVRKRVMSTLTDLKKKHQIADLQQLGDSFLMLFPSSAAAVECAISLQLDMQKQPEIPLRIGIHCGEIISDENGVFGEGIKIASRIERRSTPGSILFSEKVYDDIKNHPWIDSTFFNRTTLEDTHDWISLYYVEHQNLNRPNRDVHHDHSLAFSNAKAAQVYLTSAGKSRTTASLLALFFGTLGVHRYYLGQRLYGLFYTAAFIVLCIISVADEVPAVLFAVAISLIDALLFMVMPRSEFNLKYNRSSVEATQDRIDVPLVKWSDRKIQRFLRKGLRRFERGRYHKAIVYFDAVLEKDPESGLAHYHLARCCAMLQELNDAFYHLEQSLKYGFAEWNQIAGDYALQNLRDDPRYADLHQYIPTSPKPLGPPDDEHWMEAQPSIQTRISELTKQFELGILSPQEFELRKLRLLK